jgi:hypothetical protein
MVLVVPVPVCLCACACVPVPVPVCLCLCLWLATAVSGSQMFASPDRAYLNLSELKNGFFATMFATTISSTHPLANPAKDPRLMVRAALGTRWPQGRRRWAGAILAQHCDDAAPPAPSPTFTLCVLGRRGKGPDLPVCTPRCPQSRRHATPSLSSSGASVWVCLYPLGAGAPCALAVQYLAKQRACLALEDSLINAGKQVRGHTRGSPVLPAAMCANVGAPGA